MTKQSDLLRTAIADNSKALIQAQADAELYARLTNASAEVLRLRKAGDKLTADLSRAVNDEAKAEREAGAAKYRNLSITTSFPQAGNRGVVSAILSIRWEEPRWDYLSNETTWTPMTSQGFPALDPRVYAYIMEYRTDAIPSIIMDLAPGDPQEAMNRYFSALRRGYN